MNANLEFHDSEVSSVVAEAAGLCVRFSAASVNMAAESPDVDLGDGYLRGIELQLEEPLWSGNLSDCFGKLSDGQLFINGESIAGVPLPCSFVGKIQLRLQFSNGAELSASGAGVKVGQAGEAGYVERLSC